MEFVVILIADGMNSQILGMVFSVCTSHPTPPPRRGRDSVDNPDELCRKLGHVATTILDRTPDALYHSRSGFLLRIPGPQTMHCEGRP